MVTIPMAHGVDSLNVAAAAAVVLYALAVDRAGCRADPVRGADERPMTDRAVTRPQRAVYRRRRIVVFGSLAIVLALLTSGGVYTANALGAPDPGCRSPPSPTPTPVVAAPQPLALPGFGALRGRRRRVRRAPRRRRRPTARCRCASITKVITALVVLDAHPIPAGEGGPEIAYTEADVDIYWDMIAQNGSVAPVEAGSTLTPAREPRGDAPALGQQLRDLDRELGLRVGRRLPRAARAAGSTSTASRTRALADSSGLSLDNVSTAADLVALGKLALADPTVAEIVGRSAVDVPELGTLKNSNKLLGTHGVDGIKTGTTDDAANLLFSADFAVGSSSVTVVGVLLGGETHAMLNEAIAALLDSRRARVPRGRAARGEPGARRVRHAMGRDGSGTARPTGHPSSSGATPRSTSRCTPTP